MGKRAIRWLYSQLPVLVEQGVLSADAAERVKKHYGETESSSRQAVFIACGVLGAMLIGSGIILLLAHNWEELTRFTRTIFAFLPVVIGQAAVAWTLLRRPTSTAWREGSAAFLILSIAACIALIGQTYNIPGNLESFLLTCVLLAAPLPYLLKSNMAAALYFVGITSWAGAAQESGGHAFWFWPLAALMVPYVVTTIRENRYGLRTDNLLWIIGLCLTVVPGIVLEKNVPGLWTVVYPSLFVVMYLVGKRWFDERHASWQKPLQFIGMAGTIVLALMLTYPWPWESFGWQHYRTASRYVEWASVTDYTLAFALPILAMVLVLGSNQRREISSTVLATVPFVAVLAFLTSAYFDAPHFAQLLFNVLLFGFGIATLRSGFQKSSLGAVNGGLAILSMLAVARFFDSEIGFVARGLIFIVVGTGFLVFNGLLVRKRNLEQEVKS